MMRAGKRPQFYKCRHWVGLFLLAWVLWNEITITEGTRSKRTWTIENAFVEKPGCDEMMKLYINRMMEIGFQKTSWNQVRTKDGKMKNRFLCLPDTVDPRP